MNAGEPVDRCQLVAVDGETVRAHGDLQTPEDREAFAEVVRAARRRFDAEQAALDRVGEVRPVGRGRRRPRLWQLVAFVAIGVAIGVAEGVLLDLVDSFELVGPTDRDRGVRTAPRTG